MEMETMLVSDGEGVLIDRNSMVIDYSCRICLQTLSESYNLAGTVEAGKEHVQTLREIMMQICMVTIEPDDGLPHSICEECKELLLSAYKLQLLAQNSDAELRKRRGLQTIAELQEPEEEEDEQVEISLDEDDSEDSAGQIKEDVEIDGEKESSGEVSPSTVKRRFGLINPKCEVCGKHFQKQSYLTRHKSVHAMDPNRPFQCTICYKRFHLQSTLKLHGMIHENAAKCETARQRKNDHMPVIYRCQECDSEFASQAAFDEHWKVHEENEEQNPDLNDLEEVEIDGTEEKPTIWVPNTDFKCDFCAKTCKKVETLMQHMKTYHPKEEMVHKCTICDLQLPLGGLLLQHIDEHRNEESRYACPECEKSFKTPRSLATHAKAHQKVGTSYLCNDCGKNFRTQTSLSQHMIRHTGEKPYACEQCPGRFVTKGSLISHLRIHTGERPYECPMCDAAFNSHFSLSKHKRTHSGERPYVCEICGMRFNSSYHVRRHVRTHTGDKPYQCNFCERSFAQSNDLVKHKRSHVGTNTYQCDECPEAFRLNSELRLHKAQHFLKNKKVQAQEEMMVTEQIIVETVEEDV